MPAAAKIVDTPGDGPRTPPGGAPVDEESGSTLSVDTTSSTVGAYRCVVTGAGGLASESEPAVLAITEKPTYFVDLPNATAADPGKPFVLAVAVNGSLPVTFV